MRKKLTGKFERRLARRVRDGQWAFMEKIARLGVVHVCTWNKRGRSQGANEERFGLLDWFETAEFIRSHRSWFGRGPWDFKRDTFPMWLTPAGRVALANRPDDRQPVFGGLVEPGWQSIPLDFHRDLNEQRMYVRERGGLSRPAYVRPLELKAEPPVLRQVKRRRRQPMRKAA